MKIFLFLIISINYAYAQKIAMIDTGVNINKIDNLKVFHQSYLNCKYFMNMETRKPCQKYDDDFESHGTKVFEILSNNLPNDSVLIYSYADINNSLKTLSKFKYPSSLKEVYLKKQVLIKQSQFIAQAIDFAKHNGASVINISLGDRGFNTEELKFAIESNHDILFVFAAGNNGNDMNVDYNKIYPCAYKYKHTLCIGSLNKKKIATYSNYGTDIDIYVTPKNEEGTSFSAPIIANEAFKLRQKNTISKTVELLKMKYKGNYAIKN